ncbi:MAG: hypothetical protein BGO78_05700 [Chloroflexi bacterium 44-23]|nr:MAG: hypothetical protein BGO78_05700 [Chloroflexi bacterium 44-23]
MTLDHPEWLDAYFDQELNPIQTHIVEQHLISCEQCRVYLEGRDNLRKELQSLSGIISSKSNQRFLDEIRLRTQRRGVETIRIPLAKLLWYLVPITLLLALNVFQIYGWFTGLVDLIPGSSQFIVTSLLRLISAADGLSWLPTLLFPGGNLFGIAALFQWNFLNQIITVAALAVLYCVWMALWLLKNQRQSLNL